MSGYAGVIVAHGRVSQRLGAARTEIRFAMVCYLPLRRPEDGTARLSVGAKEWVNECRAKGYEAAESRSAGKRGVVAFERLCTGRWQGW